MTTLERVQKAVSGVLYVPLEKLNPTAPISQLVEIDSLTLAEVAAALDDEFTIRLTIDLTTSHSLEDLARLVDACRGSEPTS